MRLSALLASALSAAACAAFLAGCKNAPPAKPAEAPLVQSVSREKLVVDLMTDIQRVVRLRGKARITAIDQNSIVPASPEDATRQQEGKPYNAVYNKRSLSGYVILDRSAPGVEPRLKFVAEVPAVQPVLQLLALDDKFWVKLPNSDRSLGAYRSVLYIGEYERGASRVGSPFTMRPQDLADLFFCQELLPTAYYPDPKVYTFETWPDCYIINVLRVDTKADPASPWKAPIYSRIWVERQNLTVSVHQIYDSIGALVAEARFSDYVSIPGRVGEDKRPVAVRVPHRIRMLWPQDRVIIDVAFDRGDLIVNGKPFEESTWRPFSSDDAIVRDLIKEKPKTPANPLRGSLFEKNAPGNEEKSK